MDDTATPNGEASEARLLIETDSGILDQVRKDLSEEYTRFMSALVKQRLGLRDGGNASVFEHLNKAGSSSSAKGQGG